MKNYIFILFLFLVIFLSNNVLGKTILYYNIIQDKEASILTNFLPEDFLINIKGNIIKNPLDDSQGRKPKVYLIQNGETSSGILDSGIPASPYIFMIVWPDGTTDFQNYNPYTGQIYIPIDAGI